MSRAWLFPIVIAALAAAAIALVGMTLSDFGAWYASLAKPRWAPAEAAYGVAWTGVYALAALAGAAAWMRARSRADSEWLIGLFALNGFLNVLWNILFFRLQRPDLALIAVVVLWLSVVALLLFIWRRSMAGAMLILPYLLWVTYVGYLDMTIMRLN